MYTFGFGSDHNGDLLTAISNAANGVYYFIDSTEKVFHLHGFVKHAAPLEMILLPELYLNDELVLALKSVKLPTIF